MVMVFAFIFGATFSYFIKIFLDKSRMTSATSKADQIVKEAQSKSESIEKDTLIKAKDQAEALREEAEREIKRNKKEIERQEAKIQKREESLDHKLDNVQKRVENLEKKEKRLITLEQELEEKVSKEDQEIERIAALTQDQAKNLLLERIDKKLDLEYARRLADYEVRVKEDADKMAKKIVTLAIQRTAVEHVAETTTSEVKLPSDDMKGRIIGREGRNIRTFETITGVEVIIDDTPEAVVLSAFDPVRRAIARLTLEKLVQDGRIHPARIEEMYEKSKKEIDKAIWEAGQEAVLEVGIGDVNP